MRLTLQGCCVEGVGLTADSVTITMDGAGPVSVVATGVHGPATPELCAIFGITEAPGGISVTKASFSVDSLEEFTGVTADLSEAIDSKAPKRARSPSFAAIGERLEEFQAQNGPAADTVYRASQRLFSNEVLELCSDDALKSIADGSAPGAVPEARDMVMRVMDAVTSPDNRAVSDILVLMGPDGIVSRTRYGWRKTSVSMLFASCRTVVNAYEYSLLYRARVSPDDAVRASLCDLYVTLQALGVDGFFYAKSDADFYANRPMKLGAAVRPDLPRDEIDDELMDFAHTMWASAASKVAGKRSKQQAGAFMKAVTRMVTANARKATDMVLQLQH